MQKKTAQWLSIFGFASVMTAIHYAAHHSLMPSADTILLPLEISGILFASYGILRPLAQKLIPPLPNQSIFDGFGMGLFVALVHFTAHVVSSYLIGIPILDNKIIGIAGSFTFLGTLFIEGVWKHN